MSNQQPISISNSEIQTFKECRRKWWFTYYRRLAPKTHTVVGPLALGSRVHNALEAYYTDGQDPLKVHANLVEQDRILLLMEERDLADLEKDGELGRIMLEGYMEWIAETGADANWEVISAEKKIATPMLDGQVELMGKLDMRIRRLEDDVRLFVDHKALHVDQVVVTPSGERRIGDLAIGDEVIAPDGSTTRVTGVFPQGVVDLFDVHFTDKTSVKACGDHLWQVQRQSGRTAVMTTNELISDGLRNRHRQHKWHVPLVEPMKLDLGPSPTVLDPYILGVLLGDGSRGGTDFCSWDEFIPDEVERRLTSGQRLYRSSDNHGFGVRDEELRTSHEKYYGTRYKRSPLQHWYRTTGLANTYSHQRFVPTAYLWAPAADRLDLLRGLMDTDGCVRARGKQTVFTTTSPQLAENVAWLTRSLGGYATVSKQGTGKLRNADGVVTEHRMVYGVSLRLPQNVCPFALPRKADAWSSVTRRVEKRYVTAIEPAGRGEAVCISVAHADALYITDNFTVTHNTSGNFSDISRTAHMSEQFLMYHLLETLQPDEDQRCDGGVYNMLKKVKRTGNARPPFYERLEVRHNKTQLRSFWARIHGVLSTIVNVRQALDDGADHHVVAYPTPTRDCTWKCPFFAVCPMTDDGSAAERAIEDLYIVHNPYERYEDA